MKKGDIVVCVHSDGPWVEKDLIIIGNKYRILDINYLTCEVLIEGERKGLASWVGMSDRSGTFRYKTLKEMRLEKLKKLNENKNW